MKARLFTDADNTLWDTDAVFAAAQLEMLREVEGLVGCNAPHQDDHGLAFLRDVDQKIAAAHPEHLRYPPSLLANGLAMVLQGSDVDTAVARLIAEPGVTTDESFERIQHRFRETIQTLPPLRPGVLEGLSAAAAANIPVTIVTEESREKCGRFVAAHHLQDLITGVISGRKTTAAFLALKNDDDARYFMVGDQADRDIIAAEAAGFRTFYFPGGFEPYWNANLGLGNALKIDRYDAVVPAILADIGKAG